jgi:enoyl-CoA hydratase/carnithine racemase
VVLSGAGRAFCAGLDFQSFQAMEGRPPRENTGDLLSKGPQTRANAAQSVAWAWREAPMPVIAAVHGVAFGGGLQIALGADIRFVAPDARLSIMEGRWGLVPDMAGTQLLRHVAREDFVKELTYTARIVQGVEAVEVGLATHVSEEPREAALALAREIAQKSPHAVRAQKALLNQSVELDAATGLALEASLQASLIGTPNQQEAVRANLEKRPATYQDPG